MKVLKYFTDNRILGKKLKRKLLDGYEICRYIHQQQSKGNRVGNDSIYRHMLHLSKKETSDLLTCLEKEQVLSCSTDMFWEFTGNAIPDRGRKIGTNKYINTKPSLSWETTTSINTLNGSLNGSSEVTDRVRVSSMEPVEFTSEWLDAEADRQRDEYRKRKRDMFKE